MKLKSPSFIPSLQFATLTEAKILFMLYLALLAVAIVATALAIVTLRSRRRRGDYALIDDYEGGIHWEFVPQAHLNDEEALIHLAEEHDYGSLPPEEQESYQKAQEFTQQNPPRFEMVRGSTFTAADQQAIRERGTAAFTFEPDTQLVPRYVVVDKTEVHFVHNDKPYQTATAVLNYPYPTRDRVCSDTVYFEAKVFEYVPSANGHFAIGLVTRPYPSSFRLPGYNLFSIAYESTGNLKINKPFPTPSQQHTPHNPQYNAFVLPPLLQSDVVGFGYVASSGTVFITRNGRKLMDVVSGCYVDMFPAVGCFSTNAKFHCNVGQMGYVWIEANVRKYAFVPQGDRRAREVAALPQYNTAVESDRILDKGDDLPPRYPEHELDFFGRSVRKETKEGSSSRITNVPEDVMDLNVRRYEKRMEGKKEQREIEQTDRERELEQTEQTETERELEQTEQTETERESDQTVNSKTNTPAQESQFQKPGDTASMTAVIDGVEGNNGERRERHPETERPEGSRDPETERPEGPRDPETDRPEGPRDPETERPEGPRDPETERPEGRSETPESQEGDEPRSSATPETEGRTPERSTGLAKKKKGKKGKKKRKGKK